MRKNKRPVGIPGQRMFNPQTRQWETFNVKTQNWEPLSQSNRFPQTNQQPPDYNPPNPPNPVNSPNSV